MKKLILTTACIAATLAAFAATQPTKNAPQNLRLVAVGYCVFEDEHSYNDFMYTPENFLPVQQGFHRLTVSNIQTGEFIVSNAFAIHDWNEPAATPTTTPTAQNVAVEIIELEMDTERF